MPESKFGETFLLLFLICMLFFVVGDWIERSKRIEAKRGGTPCRHCQCLAGAVALEREAHLRCGLKRIRAIASDSTFPDDGAYDRIAEEATSLLDALAAPPETGATDAR